jgi:predicted nucleotidyltransferase
MIDKLISSKARIEIMKLFLFNPHDSYYQSQVSSLTHQPIRAVQRELERLVGIGLTTKSAQGNRYYYMVNTNCAIYPELKAVFFKTVGLPSILKARLSDEEDIRVAFIYGSYAKDQENSMSDIDLMVMGNISSRNLSSILAEAKAELGREINYVISPESEFRQKVREEDHFFSSVVKDKKLFIIGDSNELKKIIRTK